MPPRSTNIPTAATIRCEIAMREYDVRCLYEQLALCEKFEAEQAPLLPLQMPATVAVDPRVIDVLAAGQAAGEGRDEREVGGKTQ